jgi:hypothetical protein
MELTERPIERYRSTIERFNLASERPEVPLRNRERLIDRLTDEILPFLDAIIDAEAAEERLTRYERVIREHGASTLSVVAKLERVGARQERRAALARLRELMKDEETLLRYVLLRQLIRCSPEEEAPAPEMAPVFAQA